MMITSGHALNEMMDGVMGYLLPDLDQGIKLLGSLRCKLAALDGPQQYGRGVLLDLVQTSMEANQ